MPRALRWSGFLLVLLASSPVWGQSAVPLPTDSLTELGRLLRTIAVQSLPKEIQHESTRNWGQQATVPTLQGLRVVRVQRNHGKWQKTRVVSHPLAQHLELRVHQFKSASDGRISFKLFLALPVTVNYEQQTWQNGFRIFQGNVRARMRVKLDLALETKFKLDGKSEIVPDVVIDFKIADAKVSYDNFVLENVNGIGGDVARLMGEAVRAAVHRWLPRVERQALDKGREAILKAGQSREVRINLARLMKLPAARAK